MTRSAVLVSLLILVGCAAPQTPQVTGRYAARFSDTDLQQISSLISKRRDIKHNITKITMERPYTVRVETGRLRYTGDVQTIFMAHKRGGRWTIDESSIEAERVAATD
jgi:hypothetical protein